MADLLKVTIGVSGHGDVTAMLDQLGDARSIVDTFLEARVHHNPGACAACVANNNPALVPFAGCEGAKKAARGKRIEAAKAKKERRQPKPKVVTGCRCTVVFVPKDEN